MTHTILPSIAVCGIEIDPIMYRGQPVLTFAMIDEVHRRAKGTARKRFTDNKRRLLEGTDWLKISLSEIRTTNPKGLSTAIRSKVVVVTESGYLLLVKSFTDDLAWEIQRHLINTYFRMGRPSVLNNTPLSPADMALLDHFITHKTARFPHLSADDLRAQLCQHFAIAEVDALPASRLKEALVFVHDWLASCPSHRQDTSAAFLPVSTQVFHHGPQDSIEARALHQALDNRRHYSDWIKQRIQRYGFCEGTDYLGFSQHPDSARGGRPINNFHLTLDMAKALCRIENTAQGHQVYHQLCVLTHGAQRPAPVNVYADMQQAMMHLTQAVRDISAQLRGLNMC